MNPVYTTADSTNSISFCTLMVIKTSPECDLLCISTAVRSHWCSALDKHLHKMWRKSISRFWKFSFRQTDNMNLKISIVPHWNSLEHQCWDWKAPLHLSRKLCRTQTRGINSHSADAKICWSLVLVYLLQGQLLCDGFIFHLLDLFHQLVHLELLLLLQVLLQLCLLMLKLDWRREAEDMKSTRGDTRGKSHKKCLMTADWNGHWHRLRVGSVRSKVNVQILPDCIHYLLRTKEENFSSSATWVKAVPEHYKHAHITKEALSTSTFTFEKTAVHRELEFPLFSFNNYDKVPGKMQAIVEENSSLLWSVAKEPAHVVLHFIRHRNFREYELNRPTTSKYVIMGSLCQMFYELVLLKENT